jgi:glycosyltransferase involved in cell wall biosynthesis
MRVLHVITGLGTGGAETQLRLLVQRSRHDADVVTLYNSGAVARQLRSDGVRVTDIGMRSNRDLRALGTLLGVVRAGRYDVVHTHLYRALLYGRVAARVARVPRIVATEHSLYRGQLEGRRASAGVRGLYVATERLGNHTIAVSESVRAELEGWGVPSRRLTCVPNGVDLAALAFDPAARARTRAELGIAPDATVLGAVGRLHPNKRLDELVDAAAPLLGPRRVLLLAGGGPMHAQLAARARDHGVERYVVLAGERPAAPVLSALDVLVSPSSLETFGLAVVEALANGLPVVYRASPALEELDAHGLDAVRIGDAPEELARVLERYGPRPDRGGPAPPALAPFGIEIVAARIDGLYAELDGHGRT